MAKKELDKITLDMIQCEKDGYGVHYGRWKATQPFKKPEPVGIPEDWRICPQCGKAFKPKHKQQKYCEAVCCYDAQKDRRKDKAAAYEREYRAKRRAEASA